MAWYQSRVPRIGLEFARSFDACPSSIATFPLAAPFKVREFRRAWMPSFPHGVFYMLRNGEVFVVALVPASQDPGRIDT
jgi:hypothetical protein